MNINFNNFTFDFFSGGGVWSPPPFDPCKIYIKTLQLPDVSGIVKNVTFSFLYLKMFLEP